MESYPTFMIALVLVVRFLPVIPLVIGLIRFPKLSGRQKWIWGLMVFWVAYQILTLLITQVFVQTTPNTNPLFHLSIPVAVFCILMTYRSEIGKKIPSIIVVILGGLFTVFAVVNAFWIEALDQTPNLSIKVQAVLMILIAFFFFWIIFTEMKVLRLEKHFLMWVSLANLLLYSSMFLIYFFPTQLEQNHPGLFQNMQHIMAGVAFLHYLFYSIGMLQQDPPPEANPELT